MAKGITLRSSNLLLYLKDLQYKNPWVSRTQFFPWPRHVGRKHVGFFGRRPLGRRSIQDSLARSHILRTYVFTGHTPSYQRICPLPQLQILQYLHVFTTIYQKKQQSSCLEIRAMVVGMCSCQNPGGGKGDPQNSPNLKRSIPQVHKKGDDGGMMEQAPRFSTQTICFLTS